MTALRKITTLVAAAAAVLGLALGTQAAPLVLSPGDSVTFDTTAGTYSGTVSGSGHVYSGTAVFQFDQIDLPAGVTVTLTGSNPISLRSSSSIAIGTTLDASGVGQSGRLGGFNGGNEGFPPSPGQGPGGGGVTTAAGGCCWGGGGGGYGGAGGTDTFAGFVGAGGSTYGNPAITTLLGGSGGGGGGNCCGETNPFGGAGGGAIELFAQGPVQIAPTAQILADGADGNSGVQNRTGGGGSGGAIRIRGFGGVDLAAGALLSATGGESPPLGGNRTGGGGGGGRIAVYSGGLSNAATLDVSGGAAVNPADAGDENGQLGTIHFAPSPALPLTSGMALWLDASDLSTITTSGSQVTQWRDKSGNDRHANAGATKRPDLAMDQIGGLPALQFNRDQLTVAGGLGIGAGDERTLFMVMDYSTLTNNSEMFGTSTAAMIDVGTWNRSQRLRLRDEAHDGNAFSAANSVPTGSHILAVQAPPSSTMAWSDGVQIISTTGDYQHYDMTADVGIGGAFFNNREYIGNLAEVIVYDRGLSTNDMNAVGYSLQQKYGIAGSYTAPLPNPALPVTSGLELWLDATDRPTLTFGDNGEISQWDDKSGNDNHAVASAGKRPQLAMGGIGGKRDALLFNRDQMTVNGLTIGPGDERTLFLVMDYSTLTQNSEIFGTNTGTMIDVGTFFQSERLRLRDTASNGGSGGDDGYSGIYSGNGTLPTGMHILAVQGLSSGTVAMADGVEILNRPGSFFHYDLTGNVGIGGAFFNNREYIGNLAEVLLFDHALTAWDLNKVGYYLAQKYGIETSYVAPEPSTLLVWSLLAGLGVGAAWRRRRRA